MTSALSCVRGREEECDEFARVPPDPQAATLIKTVRSGGYMFTPRVEPVSVEAVTAAGR